MDPVSKIADMRQPSEAERDIFDRVAVHGYKPADVAKDVELTPRQVDKITRRVERWLALRHRIRDPESMVAMHSRRLEHQWREAMDAWYRSWREETTTKVSTGKGDSKAEKTVRTRNGDVRFLEQARRTLAEMRTLSGIEAGRREEHGHVETLTPEQRRTEVDRVLEEICDRIGEAVPGATAFRQPRQLMLFDI